MALSNVTFYMLEDVHKAHPLTEEQRYFIRRILNIAYQEGKLAGINTLINNRYNNEQDNTLRNKC